MAKGTNLNDFIATRADQGLTNVLLSLAECTKMISRLVSQAGISDILGATGTVNFQGETVQKLDELSNRMLMDYLRAGGACAGYLSEENEGVVTLQEGGQYVVAVDPLDGSSNIDVAAPIGTIFSVHRRLSASGQVSEADFLQPGRDAVAAGYVVYGSSTVLMLSVGEGVYGFTFHAADNSYYLTYNGVKIPAAGKIYSVNQGNSAKFDEGLKRYLEWCIQSDKDTGRPYSLRYIGSMVGDLHRTLLKGGIFIYPANKGEAKGKLRLLYECVPMSYLVEQAGGRATDGKVRILDIIPAEIHERSAIYIGSAENVKRCEEFLHGGAV
ncbi:MAG: class 1 fructose-bisphosphatase [Chitinophagales bacterium]|nr:class 1 fructose-bisphosphatase [Chitinophagales bacterium]MDW8418078.1 class 1 fructose-bisphosphatase [Chitinophagales bacterium]